MAIVKVDAKLRLKRTNLIGTVPTSGPSNDHTDGSWNDTDIYPGELMVQLGQPGNTGSTESLWVRTDENIRRIPLISNSGTTGQILTKAVDGSISYWADNHAATASYWTAGTGTNAIINNNGSINKASGSHAISEGYNTTASGALGSHAEGYNTTASGIYGSHSEGYYTRASGKASHAEGYVTIATNYGCHSEGQNTTASGEVSHAQGSHTVAFGRYSHTGGRGTASSKLNASGQSAFNHSTVDNTFGGIGASADQSVILGGLNHSISVTSVGSAIIGGTGITASNSNTVYVPQLNIDTALITANTENNLLVRASDGSIKSRDGSKLTQKFTETFNYVANTVHTITHNLGSADIVINLIDTVTGARIDATVDNYQTNSVDVTSSVNLTIKSVIIG